MICEEVEPSSLTNEVKNNIILALTTNITDDLGNPEPTLLSIKALCKSIPYVAPNFQVQNERDFIMQKVFLTCKHPEEEIMQYGLECLRDIAVQEYESVSFYFLEICQVTEAATKSTSCKVGA